MIQVYLLLAYHLLITPVETTYAVRRDEAMHVPRSTSLVLPPNVVATNKSPFTYVQFMMTELLAIFLHCAFPPKKMLRHNRHYLEEGRQPFSPRSFSVPSLPERDARVSRNDLVCSHLSNEYLPSFAISFFSSSCRKPLLCSHYVTYQLLITGGREITRVGEGMNNESSRAFSWPENTKNLLITLITGLRS